MAKVRKIEPKSPKIGERKRVAVYARASKDTERMIHSISTQVSFSRSLIQANAKWEYVGVYTDCGISGSGIKERTEFRRLLADCEAGNIDIVLTKSISRFARNTLDLLSIVRHLKDIGVEVQFEKEHIRSFSRDGELMLTLLASVAQEESYSISENVKWGIRKRLQSGEIGTANKHVLGYRYDEDEKKYVIIPEEAEVVRQMFSMFIEGLSYREMANRLNSAGHRTIHGHMFMGTSIRTILHNEIYVGDIRRQKCLIENSLTKHKVKNKGQLPQYYRKDCHEAIISRNLWKMAQEEGKRRATMLHPIYPFSGKIKCGVCGRTFTRSASTTKGRRYVKWICRAKKEKGLTCQSHNYKEEKLEKICAELLGMETFDGAELKKQIKEITALSDGSLEYHFYDGRKERWQRM